jgi:hypothetical protein
MKGYWREGEEEAAWSRGFSGGKDDVVGIRGVFVDEIWDG